MKRIAAIAALLVAASGVAFALLRGNDDSDEKARAAVTAFAATWSRGDDARAGALTDAAPVAAKALKANRAGLDGAKVSVRPGPLTRSDDRASGRLRIEWRIPAIGSYAYTAPVSAVKFRDAWIVHWSPRTIHPRLTAATRLGTAASSPRRADILDRDGRPLVSDRAVVRVGLEHDKVQPGSVEQLAKALDVDEKPLQKAVDGSGPKQFVEAETFRKADYEKLDLPKIPGLLAVDGTAPLAPSRAFGRPLLGGVSDGKGQWGLEQVYDARLAGKPTRRILIRESDSGAGVRTLRRLAGRAAKTLRTTLSAHAQSAAESALAGERHEAALVALQPSTGDILAVANRPTDNTFDRALAGVYAPGSTFKVITTAALIRDGFDTHSRRQVPADDRRRRQDVQQLRGRGVGQCVVRRRLRDLVQHGLRLACAAAARERARQGRAGLRARAHLRVGIGTARTHVPPGTDRVSRAAAMIGQDRITVTPLSLAGVAGAVAEGRWHQPRLLSSDASKAGPQLDGGELATLRDLMQQVVTRGTAASAGLPADVAGKTGTAEFGDADPPETHAWFIAYRGDLAIAVLVEKGRSGGAVAAPLAAKFFSAYGP